MKKEDFERELHTQFLQSLHEEKVKTQAERANYISSKFAFITGLFGLGALRTGAVDFSMLLYFIPLVAVGYDLYIRAADLSIKKMGAFLRTDPAAGTAPVERAWERFAATRRDKLAQRATTMFSYVIIIGAALLIFIQSAGATSPAFRYGFPAWLIVSLAANWALSYSHRRQVRMLDELTAPDSAASPA
jgi:hypothetical protein